ncbi:MAG: hypothetical protein QG602_2710, partial [Verrucomicrobiota bacterium]|nr:hypothetical protein [Verrucomicrobiota bacterium]
AAHPALRTGAMLPRVTTHQDVFAFSRIDRRERVEYLAVFNRSRTQTLSVAVPTSQQAGAKLMPLFASSQNLAGAVTTDAEGRVSVSLAPLHFAVWRAPAPLAAVATPAALALVNPAPGAALKFSKKDIDGLVFPSRVEIRAEASGGDGLGEVTFTLERASRPGQIEYLGTDDAAPYRVFWRPPHDLGPGEKLTLSATHNDLRGRLVRTEVTEVMLASTEIPTGLVGAKVPVITRKPVGETRGGNISLTVAAEGTGPLEYQWLRDGEEVAGATTVSLTLQPSRETAGSYRVLVRNRAGTTLSSPVEVRP